MAQEKWLAFGKTRGWGFFCCWFPLDFNQTSPWKNEVILQDFFKKPDSYVLYSLCSESIQITTYNSQSVSAWKQFLDVLTCWYLPELSCQFPHKSKTVYANCLSVALFCHLYSNRHIILKSGTQEANNPSSEGGIISSTLNGRELRAKTPSVAM